MHRLGVYRIRLPKNKISKSSAYMTLVWRETDGDSDGHTICFKDADTSDSMSVSGRHRTDSLKESVNHPLTVKLSLGVLKVWIAHQTNTRKDTFKPERHRQAFSATQTVRARYCQLARYNLTNSICPRTPGASGAKKLDIYITYLGSPNEVRGSDTLTLI